MSSSAYDEFLNLPPSCFFRSASHVHAESSCTFCPFRCLVGYDALIRETTRLTDHRAELDESEKAALDRRLQLLYQNLLNAPRVSIVIQSRFPVFWGPGFHVMCESNDHIDLCSSSTSLSASQ